MPIPGTPTSTPTGGPMVTPPRSSAFSGYDGGGDVGSAIEQAMRYNDPEMLNALTYLTSILGSGGEAQAVLAQADRQFVQNLEYDKWRIEEELSTQLQIARSSNSAAARINAQNRAATLEAARIDANARIQTARIDANARIKSVAMQVAAQLKDIVATTTARPIDWVKQTAMLGGVPEAQAPTTGVQDYLRAPIPGVSQTAVNAPLWRPNEGDQAWQAFRAQNVAPQAVVGERGPELATATPQGTVISPLAEQVRRGFGGIARMAQGGIIPSFGQRYQISQRTLPSYLQPGTQQTQGGITPSWQRYNAWQTENPQGTRQQWLQAMLQRRRPYGVSGNPPRSIEPPVGMAQGGTVAWNPRDSARRVDPRFQPGRYGQPQQTQQPAQPQATTPTGRMSLADWQKQLWGGWPAFQATTLSRSPAALQGGQVERWPWEENLNSFLQAPSQVQQARLASWRAAGVISGETLDEQWNSAMQFMTQAGFVGANRGLNVYG